MKKASFNNWTCKETQRYIDKNGGGGVGKIYYMTFSWSCWTSKHSFPNTKARVELCGHRLNHCLHVAISTNVDVTNVWDVLWVIDANGISLRHGTVIKPTCKSALSVFLFVWFFFSFSDETLCTVLLQTCKLNQEIESYWKNFYPVTYQPQIKWFYLPGTKSIW